MSKLSPFYVEVDVGQYDVEKKQCRRRVAFPMKSTDPSMVLTIKVDQDGESIDYLKLVIARKANEEGTYCIASWKSQTGECVLSDEVII